ncbi:unnamed protein product [Calypogeia fissa]
MEQLLMLIETTTDYVLEQRGSFWRFVLKMSLFGSILLLARNGENYHLRLQHTGCQWSPLETVARLTFKR